MTILSNDEIVTLLTEERRNLIGFLTMLTGDRFAADDLFQETCLEALRLKSKFKRDTNFRAWVHSVARFQGLRYLRSRGSGDAAFSPELIEKLMDTWVEETTTSFHEQRQEALKSCMTKLEERHREILDLRYRARHSHPHIAECLETSTDAIKMLMSRLRKKLRLCVEMTITDMETRMIEESS